MGVLRVIHTAYSIYSPVPLEPMVIVSILPYRTKKPDHFYAVGQFIKTLYSFEYYFELFFHLFSP